MTSRPPKPRKPLPPLSRLELRILGVLWKLGPSSSADVIAESNRDQRRADTTVRTVLSNLRRKGYVELVPTTERQHIFRATVKQDDVASRTFKDLVAGLFAGSSRQALMHLIDSNDLTDDDYEALRVALEQKKRGGRSK